MQQANEKCYKLKKYQTEIIKQTNYQSLKFLARISRRHRRRRAEEEKVCLPQSVVDQLVCHTLKSQKSRMLPQDN